MAAVRTGKHHSQPATLTEVLERIESDLVVADALLRFRQGQVDELKREVAALRQAMARYAVEGGTE